MHCVKTPTSRSPSPLPSFCPQERSHDYYSDHALPLPPSLGEHANRSVICKKKVNLTLVTASRVCPSENTPRAGGAARPETKIEGPKCKPKSRSSQALLRPLYQRGNTLGFSLTKSPMAYRHLGK